MQRRTLLIQQCRFLSTPGPYLHPSHGHTTIILKYVQKYIYLYIYIEIYTSAYRSCSTYTKFTFQIFGVAHYYDVKFCRCAPYHSTNNNTDAENDDDVWHNNNNNNSLRLIYILLCGKMCAIVVFVAIAASRITKYKRFICNLANACTIFGIYRNETQTFYTRFLTRSLSTFILFFFFWINCMGF